MILTKECNYSLVDDRLKFQALEKLRKNKTLKTEYVFLGEKTNCLTGMTWNAAWLPSKNKHSYTNVCPKSSNFLQRIVSTETLQEVSSG